MTRTEEDSTGGQGARRVWDTRSSCALDSIQEARPGVEGGGGGAGRTRKEAVLSLEPSLQEGSIQRVVKVIVDMPAVKGAA